MIPKEADKRKSLPVATGVIDYFPDALVAIAEVSRRGNDQHNPGKPLHWDRTKSQDESDALMRHFIERGSLDSDGLRHTAKVAWRALALLQKEIENERASNANTKRSVDTVEQCHFEHSYWGAASIDGYDQQSGGAAQRDKGQFDFGGVDPSGGDQA